jgi:hypothetical protein
MKKSIDVDFFLSNEVYDDDYLSNCYHTFRRNEHDFESGISTFGEWWVVHTTSEKYQA